MNRRTNIVKTYRHSDGSTILTIPAHIVRHLEIEASVIRRVFADEDRSRPVKITVRKASAGDEKSVKAWRANRGKSLVVPLPGGSRHPIVKTGLHYAVTVDDVEIRYDLMEIKT